MKLEINSVSNSCRLGGHAAFTLGFSELGDGIAAEDSFEGFAGLVPDFARYAKRGVFYVADPTGATSGRPNRTVQDLDDIENGNVLWRRREAVTTVRPAAAFENVRPTKLTEDLLQETLRDVLAPGDFGDAKRLAAIVQSQLHQSPGRIFAFLCEPHEYRSLLEGELTLKPDCSISSQLEEPDPGLLVAYIAVEVLLHGALNAFSGDKENGAPADAYPVVTNPLQIVDHQGGSHAPFRVSTTTR